MHSRKKDRNALNIIFKMNNNSEAQTHKEIIGQYIKQNNVSCISLNLDVYF